MMKVAAVVVLYHPPEEIIDNINSYIEEVEKVYVIDNSEEATNDEIIDKLKKNSKVELVILHQNKGIAKALNIGGNKAITDGFDYVLTMDQDSSIPENMVQKLYSIINEDKYIGLVAAEHFNREIHKTTNKVKTEEILYTMTSGNLINLYAFKEIGGFDEKLFIDHVDHEYCLRLKKNGFKIIKTNSALVYHRLGKSEIKKFHWFNIYPTHHSPVRIYYRTRNRLYINHKYKRDFPEYVLEDRRHFFRELIDMILGEKNIYNKLKMILKGYSDYKKNKFGKID